MIYIALAVSHYCIVAIEFIFMDDRTQISSEQALTSHLMEELQNTGIGHRDHVVHVLDSAALE